MHYFKAFLKFKKTQQKPNQQTHKQQKKPAKLCSPNTVLVTFLSSFLCMFVQLTAQNIWMLHSTPAKSNRRMTIHQNQPDNRKHIPIPELLLSDSKWQGMKQKEHRAWFATAKLSPKNDKEKNPFNEILQKWYKIEGDGNACNKTIALSHTKTFIK